MTAPRAQRQPVLALLLPWIFLATPHSPAAPTPDPLDAWLAHQTNIASWQADVIQTRSLKSLVQPLVTPGRVWFQAPHQFRWELGSPAKTIACRQSDELVLLYPALKRAEIYPLASSQGPWRDSMTLLEAGFPRSAQDLRSRFNIQSLATNANTLEVKLQPKAAQARRWMPSMLVTLSSSNLTLLQTEMFFADGSRLLNRFENPQLNPVLEPSLFAPPIPPEFEVSRPSARP